MACILCQGCGVLEQCDLATPLSLLLLQSSLEIYDDPARSKHWKGLILVEDEKIEEANAQEVQGVEVLRPQCEVWCITTVGIVAELQVAKSSRQGGQVRRVEVCEGSFEKRQSGREIFELLR